MTEHEPWDHEELLNNRRPVTNPIEKVNPVEVEPSPEGLPEKQPKFNWVTFSIFGALMIIAWILGQFSPWFPDELAAEILLLAIYGIVDRLGYKKSTK